LGIPTQINLAIGAAQRLYASCTGKSQHFWGALKYPVVNAVEMFMQKPSPDDPQLRSARHSQTLRGSETISSPAHSALTQPEQKLPHWVARNYRQLSVVQCRYLSRMLTAAEGPHTGRKGSGWIRGTPHASPEVLHRCFLSCCPRRRDLSVPCLSTGLLVLSAL
jgi:hypothetical protein